MKFRMKRIMGILNLILIGISLLNAVNYYIEGGLLFKGIASLSFALLGVMNLLYAVCSRVRCIAFPLGMGSGLIMSMLADVVIQFYFIPGAFLFVAAHVMYFISLCSLKAFRKRDFLLVGLTIALCLGICYSPKFLIPDPTMKIVMTVYCVVISFVLGKTISNFWCKTNKLNFLLLLGTLLFWLSDLMLALELFAGGGRLANTLCLFTYFPGQTLLASSIYCHTVGDLQNKGNADACI